LLSNRHAALLVVAIAPLLLLRALLQPVPLPGAVLLFVPALGALVLKAQRRERVLPQA